MIDEVVCINSIQRLDVRQIGLKPLVDQAIVYDPTRWVPEQHLPLINHRSEQADADRQRVYMADSCKQTREIFFPAKLAGIFLPQDVPLKRVRLHCGHNAFQKSLHAATPRAMCWPAR